MDTSFTFPPPRAAIPRPRPSGSQANGPRESNALRASVLDVALELGITNNSLVAEWMFSNTVEEEDEESAQSPGLSHSLSATFTDYSSSPQIPPTPPNFFTPPTSFGLLPTSGKPVAERNPSKLTTDVHIPYLPNESFSPVAEPVAFPSYQDVPIPPRPATPTSSRKLKKKKTDDYDSDGGYLSEAAKKKVPGELSKKESKARLKEEKRELKELKEEERKRKKSLGALPKPGKKQEESSAGYDTDGAAISKSPFKSKKSKSKTSSADTGGYETDGGYQSSGHNVKKSKTRFFKLGSKSSRGDLREVAQAVPESPREPMPLPIAQRFATSLGASSPSTANLRIETTVGTTPTPSIGSAAIAKSPRPLFTDEPPSINTSSTPEYLPLDLVSSAPSSAVQDRSSLSSAETSSSTSSNYRRRGFLPPSRESSIPTHSVGESISTINSSAISSNNHPDSQTPASPPTTYSSILKPPSISYPLTRSQSPIPLSPHIPVAPLQISRHSKLPHLDISSRGVSPHSSSVMSSPTSNVSSPFSPASIASPVPPKFTSPRPHNPPINGFRSTLTSPPLPNTTHGRLSPNPLRGRRISPLPLSQNPLEISDPSTFPSPNVLAYYDIPPPSPPPMGPLPSVPGLPASQFRNKVVERHQVSEPSFLSSQPIRRGRESPFPARPVVALQQQQSSSSAPYYSGDASSRFGNGQDSFLEQAGRSPPKDLRRVSPPEPMYGEWGETEGMSVDGIAYDSSEEDIQDVLDRFADSSVQGSDEARALTEEVPDNALASRRSFEALREKREYRETVYGWDDGDTMAKNRESRWSGSIYSRISILDPDQSEETRERFVRRVEAMMGGGGEREEAIIIPPVPGIPEGLANANSWNKF